MITKEINKETIVKIADFFSLEAKKVRDDIKVVGSPERTQFRVVFEDRANKLFVLEEIIAEQVEHKNKISKTLSSLYKKDVIEAKPYLKNQFGKFIHEYQGRFWQIIPFFKGTPLKRPRYVYDKWRGKACANFLFKFKEANPNISEFKTEDSFSLKEYVYQIRNTIEKNHPSVIEFVDPIVSFLEKSFFKDYQSLAPSFCHGDFHPMNIIWEKDDIKAVIDWEFMGYKPELYDVANMIGCLGIENPNALLDGFAVELLKTLKKRQFAPKKVFEILPEYIVAQRFAWLSEWFRKEYSDLLELEIDYMNLLIKQNKLLKKEWGLLNVGKKETNQDRGARLLSKV